MSSASQRSKWYDREILAYQEGNEIILCSEEQPLEYIESTEWYSLSRMR